MTADQYAFPFVEPIEPDEGGRPRLFDTPLELWETAVTYFQWVNANPILVEEKASADGQPTTIDIRRPRPMTIGGMCVFLGIARRTWDGYRDREGFLPVISHVEEVMRTQKYECAVAGAMNANLISRDLGLADKHQHGGDPDNKTPVPVLFELVPLQPAVTAQPPEEVTA
jgi:hypothetical protein